jgi:hypothetical protein
VFVIRQIDVSTECSAFMFKVKQSSWTAWSWRDRNVKCQELSTQQQRRMNLQQQPCENLKFCIFCFTATCCKSWRLYKYLPMITTSALSGTSTVTDGSLVTVGCFTFCNLLKLVSICNDWICNSTVQWVPQKTAFQTIMIFGGVRWMCRVTSDRERRKVFPILYQYG